MANRGSKLEVFIGSRHCGELIETATGALSFRYDPGYDGVPLSLSMPVGLVEYGDRVVRPYLMGLLPDEESTRAAIGAKYDVSGDNPFRLLAHIGGDCPGAVRVFPKDQAVLCQGDSGSLIELSDAQIAAILTDIKENAAAAWVDQESASGHWSLGGCQAKVALRRQGGRWFQCEGAAPSTHILKPGVVGMKNQALVEYLSMQLAGAVGLPVAQASYECFEDEWAIVIERYDRFFSAGKVERMHQEDFCQALSVSPLRKYAEQGGPNTPQMLELLKNTGDHARENVYRFVLYLFFNYLIGATDAHAKNHSLMMFAAKDIRLAPLYDVASNAPYQSLSPGKRKSLRAALSIGGENRFGCLGAEHIKKMVENSGLEEYELTAELLVGQLAKMAEAIPAAIEVEINRAARGGFPGINDIAEPMTKEIDENCRRTLANLREPLEAVCLAGRARVVTDAASGNASIPTWARF